MRRQATPRANKPAMRRKSTNAYPVAKRRRYRSRLNRRVSPFKASAVPIVSVLIGSLVTTLPILTSLPLLPPIGLMMHLI